MEQFIIGYLFGQSALLFAATSFACESSVTVCTAAAIVMTMNHEEHSSRWGGQGGWGLLLLLFLLFLLF